MPKMNAPLAYYSFDADKLRIPTPVYLSHCYIVIPLCSRCVSRTCGSLRQRSRPPPHGSSWSAPVPIPWRSAGGHCPPQTHTYCSYRNTTCPPRKPSPPPPPQAPRPSLSRFPGCLTPPLSDPQVGPRAVRSLILFTMKNVTYLYSRFLCITCAYKVLICGIKQYLQKVTG